MRAPSPGASTPSPKHYGVPPVVVRFAPPEKRATESCGPVRASLTRGRQAGPRGAHAGRTRRSEIRGEARTTIASQPQHVAILFDIDGTLLITGDAGATSWRLAFEELYGIPADIHEFTDTGMTDPDVGRRTFQAVLHRTPEPGEFAKLLERRMHHLHRTVAESRHYHVLPGVEALLPALLERGHLLGLVTGNTEGAAHIKLHRARLNRFFSFGGYATDANDRAEVVRAALGRASLVFGERLDTGRCLVVGDTPHDVEAAHAAAVACVGVASHRFDANALRAARADWVVDSLADGLPADALR